MHSNDNITLPNCSKTKVSMLSRALSCELLIEAFSNWSECLLFSKLCTQSSNDNFAINSSFL